MALSSDSAYVQVNVKYRVEGLKQAATESKKAAGALTNLGKIVKQVGASLLAFKAINTVRQGLMNMTKALIDSNAKFEKFEIQLKVFTGSGKQAADLMNFLAFQSTRLAGGLSDLLAGATALQTFGLDVRQNLELIADIAQATNRAVEDVAIAFGRIVAGDPRTKQFLTTRRGDLKIFNQVLAETGSRLEAARAAFGRFSGVSAELEGSFSRLVENIQDFLFVGAKVAGEPAFLALKDLLKDLKDFLQSEIFDEEGNVRAGNMFSDLADGIDAVVESVKSGRDELLFLVNMFQALTNPIAVFTGDQAKFLQNARLPAIRETLRSITDLQEQKAGLGEGWLANIQRWFVDQQIATGMRDLELLGITPEMMRDAEQSVNFGKVLESARLDAEDFFATMDKLRKSAPSLDEILGEKSVKEIKGFLEQDDEFLRRIERDFELSKERVALEVEFFNKRVDLEAQIQDILDRKRTEAIDKQKQQEEELAEFRFQVAERLTSRAVGDLGYVLFGGRGANAQIDKQIEKMREEVRVLDGAVAPLTRQEELMNRIVELEAQRVTLNERIGSIIRKTIGDLAQAVAKAALLRSLGFGTAARGQSGGFMGLLKFGLGFVPGGNIINQGLSAGANLSSTGPGITAETGMDIITGQSSSGFSISNNNPNRAGKPTVLVNNPIFLSNDTRGVAEKFAEEAERRFR